MKTIFHILLLLILTCEAVALFFTTRPKPQTEVLGEAIVATTSPIPSPQETPTPIASPASSDLGGPKPTPIKTSSPVPQPKFTSQQINEFINRFASQYEVSPDVMRHIALCESGFNPLARNSIYAGLFQFDATTWKNIRLGMKKDIDINLRLNAEEAVQTATYVVSIGGRGLWPHCYP